jgi:hypothetical protein
MDTLKTSISLVHAYHADDADIWKLYALGVPGNDRLEIALDWCILDKSHWGKYMAGE